MSKHTPSSASAATSHELHPTDENQQVTTMDHSSYVEKSFTPARSPRPSTSERDVTDSIMGVPTLAHKALDEPTRSAEVAINLKKLSVWCLRFLAIAVACVIVWKQLGTIWSGLLPTLVAIIFCTLLWPPVQWLSNHKIPRSLAVILTLIGGIAIVAGIFAAITPGVISQSEQLVNKASSSLLELKHTLNGPPLNLKDNQLDQGLDKIATQLQARSDTIITGVLSGLSTASSIAVNVGIILMLSFFFLKDGDKFLPWLDKNLNGSIGQHLHELLARSWKTLGGFIRAQAIISFLNSVFIAIGLSILNVPLALALATLNFFAGFIPIFGAFVAGAFAVVIAFVANGWVSALLVALLIFLVHQIEGNVLSPLLQSKAMELHPVLILVSIAVGSSLYGVVGTFLAVPVAAVIAVVFRYISEQIDLRVVDPVNTVVVPASDVQSRPVKRAKENLAGNPPADQNADTLDPHAGDTHSDSTFNKESHAKVESPESARDLGAVPAEDSHGQNGTTAHTYLDGEDK